MLYGRTRRTGGELLVDQLIAHGIEAAFGVPGESLLPVLDAIGDAADKLRFITCRMEAGAANMADAYAKMTGKPGVCLVARGPGACHAAVGVHTARQDSTPLVLLIAQVGRDRRDRECFQEIDYGRMFADQAKWVATVDSVDRMPEYVARALRTAVAGRPGPVVLALPEDVLAQTSEAEDLPALPPIRPEVSAGAVDAVLSALAEAERPLVIAGGGCWSAEAAADLAAVAERFDLPVAASFRAQDSLNNDHPHYIGCAGLAIDPKLAARIKAADLLLILGPRLGEITSGGYAMIEAPAPSRRLIHVYPGAEELGAVISPWLAIHAAPGPLLAALRTAAAGDADLACARWRSWTREGRANYMAFQTSWPAPPGDVDFAACCSWLRDQLPEDAVICTGAGNFSIWAHRFLRYRRWRSQLSPISGAMGYGVPAAVAAKIAAPERLAVSFNGDGCFLMCGQELATAVHYGLDPIFIVVDNGMYGTIRMHQEKGRPGRPYGVDLTNPDFAALARSYGAFAATVARTEDFAEAWTAARQAGKAALIHVKVSPEAITPTRTLEQIRAAARVEMADRG